MKALLPIAIAAILFSCQSNEPEAKPEEQPAANTEDTVSTVLPEEDNEPALVIADVGEPFLDVDISELVARLEAKPDASPTEIMDMHYSVNPEESGEGKAVTTVDQLDLPNGNKVVMLINDFQMDDSVKGEKFVLELTQTDGKWAIVSLKKNWKCYRGGSDEWTIELCP